VHAPRRRDGDAEWRQFSRSAGMMTIAQIGRDASANQAPLAANTDAAAAAAAAAERTGQSRGFGVVVAESWIFIQ
jgi:hypothetical protein